MHATESEVSPDQRTQGFRSRYTFEIRGIELQVYCYPISSLSIIQLGNRFKIGSRSPFVPAIVGAGGLGGTIVELLARQGVGHLVVMDDDCFAEQDLNRQIMSTERNLGQPKVTVATRRTREINSAITVTTRRERLTRENARRLLNGAQVVADGLDNLPSRFAVEQACRELGIPYVYGTIAGFGGQLMTIFPQDTGLSSIYGPCNALSERGIETATGNPAATPAMIAALQVQEVIKIITGIGTPTRNQILLVDASQGTADRIELTKQSK